MMFALSPCCFAGHAMDVWNEQPNELTWEFLSSQERLSVSSAEARCGGLECLPHRGEEPTFH